MRMRTRFKTSLNVYSLKLYHSCVKASSIDSSPLSIISAIRSARSFANDCEKHMLRTLDFLTPSEKRGINDNWEPPLVLFIFFQFLIFFPPDLSYRVVVSPSKRFPHTLNSLCSDTRPVSIDGEVVALIDAGLLMSFDIAYVGHVSISLLNINPLWEAYACIWSSNTPLWEPRCILLSGGLGDSASNTAHGTTNFTWSCILFTLFWNPPASYVHISGLRCLESALCEVSDPPMHSFLN